MGTPQQPEIRRSGRGRVDEEARYQDTELERPKGGKGRRGPVPPENEPGHHPEREQDKPAGLDRPS